jgi:hypothetical protein
VIFWTRGGRFFLNRAAGGVGGGVARMEKEAPEWTKNHARGPVHNWDSRSGKKYLFFLVKIGFSLTNWFFQQSFMGFDYYVLCLK